MSTSSLAVPVHTQADETAQPLARERPLRMLRLPAVKQMTGLGRSKIYELQALGDFPMRVQLTRRCVAWVEQDVQAWLSRRVARSDSASSV